MARLLCLVILVILTRCIYADESPTATFSKSGYSVALLDAGPALTGGFESMKMFLPPQEGFASNINLQHQAFPGSLSEWVAESDAGAKKVGLKISNAKLTNGVYTAEAVGKVPGIDMEFHFYFKAVKSANNVILATATIPTSRWDDEKDLLIPIVDSLRAVRKAGSTKQ